MSRVHVTRIAEQAPADFVLEGRLFRVRLVVDRWFGQDDAFFKVVTEDGTTYILRHDLEQDHWEMTLMDGMVALRQDL